MNEAMVVESSVFDSIDVENDCEGACDYIERLGEQLEKVKPAQLKRVFKGLDDKVLKDYCKILEEIAAWINGVLSIARDEEDEASKYIEMITGLGNDYQSALENIADNLYGELDSIEDGEDAYDYIEDVFKHWQEISKLVFRKSW